MIQAHRRHQPAQSQGLHNSTKIRNLFRGEACAIERATGALGRVNKTFVKSGASHSVFSCSIGMLRGMVSPAAEHFNNSQTAGAEALRRALPMVGGFSRCR